MIPTVQVLLGGAGAGGGTGQFPAASNGGGGAAGGYQYDSAHAITSQAYTVVVGQGGLGAGFALHEFNGHSGDNSSFDTITALGGGYGAGMDGSIHQGGSGGSGGGGGSNGGSGGTGYQGYNGGSSYDALVPNNAVGGGGGGAGQSGSNGTTSPGLFGASNGGNGVINPIAGSTVGQLIGSDYWVCGGGAGYFGKLGGKGGGANSSDGLGHDGTANTGGGGSGTVYLNDGGRGGSGFVVIAFPIDGSTGMSTSSTGGGVVQIGGLQIHTFNSGGTFNAVTLETNAMLGTHL